jgi:hypothetical protein
MKSLRHSKVFLIRSCVQPLASSTDISMIYLA